MRIITDGRGGSRFLSAGLFAVIVLLSGTASASDEELLDQIGAGLRLRYDSFTSCKGSVHLVMTRPVEEGEKLLAVRLVTAAFDGKRIRMSGKVHSGAASDFEGAFDGENTTEWMEIPGQPLAARIAPGLGGVTGGEFSLFVDPRAIGGSLLPISDTDPVGSARIVGREPVDGEDCIVVESTTGIPGKTTQPYVKLECWVDPDRGFAIPRMVAWVVSGGDACPVPLREQVVKLRQYGDGLWGPAMYTRTDYTPDGTVEKKVYGTYDPGFQINGPVGQDGLRLTLESGMKVHDARTGTSYTVP